MLNIFKSRAKSEDNAPKTNKQLLLKLLQDRSRTTEELRQHIAHQTLTALLSQMEAKGLIYKNGRVKGGKRYFTLWSYEENEVIQRQRAILIAHDKYHAWVRQGKKNGWFERFGGLRMEDATNE
jgi:DNA-binding transcriptional ArsR family regulator